MNLGIFLLEEFFVSLQLLDGGARQCPRRDHAQDEAFYRGRTPPPEMVLTTLVASEETLTLFQLAGGITPHDRHSRVHPTIHEAEIARHRDIFEPLQPNYRAIFIEIDKVNALGAVELVVQTLDPLESDGLTVHTMSVLSGREEKDSLDVTETLFRDRVIPNFEDHIVVLKELLHSVIETDENVR